MTPPVSAASAVYKSARVGETKSEPDKWRFLASYDCLICRGEGLVKTFGVFQYAACKCVLRNIFNRKLKRYLDLRAEDKWCSPVIPLRTSNGNLVWGRPHEEYQAEFYATAKRSLTEEQFALFRLHFLDGGDWKLCCRLLRLDRGNFFHEVYRIKERIGVALGWMTGACQEPPDMHRQILNRPSRGYSRHASPQGYGMVLAVDRVRGDGYKKLRRAPKTDTAPAAA
jgi:hypothetical protein